MKMKRAITGLLSGLFLLGMVSQAQAVPIIHNVNGTFNDGGTLMGTIEIDSAGPPFVTNFALTTSAVGSFSGFTFNTGNSIVTIDAQLGTLINSGFDRSLRFGGVGILQAPWNPILGTPSPTYTAQVTERQGIFFGAEFRQASVSAVATPEPGTILLFGSGLLGLGLLRYRKQRKS